MTHWYLFLTKTVLLFELVPLRTLRTLVLTRELARVHQTAPCYPIHSNFSLSPFWSLHTASSVFINLLIIWSWVIMSPAFANPAMSQQSRVPVDFSYYRTSFCPEILETSKLKAKVLFPLKALWCLHVSLKNNTCQLLLLSRFPLQVLLFFGCGLEPTFLDLNQFIFCQNSQNGSKLGSQSGAEPYPWDSQGYTKSALWQTVEECFWLCLNTAVFLSMFLCVTYYLITPRVKLHFAWAP